MENRASRKPSNEEYLARDRNHIIGRAEYKDKSYYLAGEGESARSPWIQLMFRDGSKTFFASAESVDVVKRLSAAAEDARRPARIRTGAEG